MVAQRNKLDKLELAGVVQEALPNGMFRIETDSGVTLVGTVSAQMRQYTVKILPNNHVYVEVSAFNPSRKRIIHQQK